VVLAVPVAPARWRPTRGVVDEYLCLQPVTDFWAVGQFYTDFTQTTDAEVVELLSRDLRDDSE
jgi:putative phosphoribosyl transferase